MSGVEIVVGPSGASKGNRVTVDGHDISAHVVGVYVDAEASRPTRAVVVLEPVTLCATPGETRLTPEVHGALIALGWTPPAGTR